MLVRLLALAVIVGLGVGLVLRVVLGRGRFPTLAALAHLPLLVHALVAARGGWSEGVGTAATLTFLAAGALLAAGGAALAYRWTGGRPLLAALMPGITGVVYTFLPFLLFERAVSLTAAAGRLPLTSFGVFFFFGAVVLVVCLLLPFAPRAAEQRRW
ncbi:MAG TPA: hypothetical protein VF202_14205 [Trueperaceae bacterium]|jgi:hypothetical protein